MTDDGGPARGRLPKVRDQRIRSAIRHRPTAHERRPNVLQPR